MFSALQECQMSSVLGTCIPLASWLNLPCLVESDHIIKHVLRYQHSDKQALSGDTSRWSWDHKVLFCQCY